MDNSKNMEPGVKDAAVQDSTNKEQRKKESRPVISAKAQTVLDFLRACSPYEADSIRVMGGYGTGYGTAMRRTRKLPFVAFRQSRCKAFRYSVPLFFTE